jgi:hypothetical protein
MWADRNAADPDEVKERQDRYGEALRAMSEQFRVIELLAPEPVVEAASYVNHSFADIWSKAGKQEPLMPADALATERFMALPVRTSVAPNSITTR